MDSQSKQRSVTNGRYNIRAIERAIAILNLFSRERSLMTLDEITRDTGLSKSTAFRVLATLEQHGYVVIDESTGKYRLGAIFLSLGAAVLTSTNLRKIASPFLNRLKNKLNVTVLLGAPVDGSLVYIDRKEAPGPLHISSDISWRRDPIHYGMLGMVLLSSWDDEEISEYLKENKLIAYTKNSLTKVDQWLQRVKEIREAGYVVEFEEAIEGVWGVAAPVKNSNGEVVAAVGVAQPISAKNSVLVSETIGSVTRCAEAISSELGYRSASNF
ncbi:MAG: hypothetical protein C0608_11165 [Deltaproteobacteria bacterium]|nr:MAG: hypothetical protein C0608_11165 [Deltaproteobacteria bacterium]